LTSDSDKRRNGRRRFILAAAPADRREAGPLRRDYFDGFLPAVEESSARRINIFTALPRDGFGSG